MKVRLLSVVVAVMATIGVSYGQTKDYTYDHTAKTVLANIQPVYEVTINGGVLFIGNTNTDFKDKTLAETEEEGFAEIIPIMNMPEGVPSSLHKNCNYAEFCIPKEKEECGATYISYARLSWNGGGLDPAAISRSAHCYITDATGTVITDFEVKSEAEETFAANQFYSFHAEVTKDFNNAFITPGRSYRVYVTDIPFSEKNPDNDNTKNCTGWTLSLVYQHNLLPRRTILLYDCDVFGQTGNARGIPGFNLFCNFGFGEQSHNGKASITFGHSSLGGLSTARRDEMLFNPSGKVEETDNLKEIYNSYPKRSKSDNIRNSVFYQYDVCGSTIGNIENTKCFGLNVASYGIGRNSGELNIQQGSSSFNICVVGDNEHHFLTNAFVMFGAPDMPEIALPIEINDNPTELQPDEDYTVNLYVSVGRNTEGLSDIHIDIPFSDYVDSLSDFRIVDPNQALFKKIDNTTAVNSSMDGSVEIMGSTIDLIYYKDLKENDVNDNKTVRNFHTKTIENINNYLAKVERKNEVSFFTSPTPTIEQRKIALNFPNLTIPTTIKETDVIKIIMTLHTKPADNWVYTKTSYTGRQATIAPQAELAATTQPSGDGSIYESENRENISDLRDYFDKIKCHGAPCYGNYCGGSIDDDGGGGDCHSLGERKTSNNGTFRSTDRTKQIEVNVSASGGCRTVPESIEIPYCDEITMYISDFRDLLASNYHFNIDDIARQDLAIWELAKRDMLIDLATSHGVNRSRLEDLLGTGNGDLATITASEEFGNFLRCEGVEGDLSTEEIEKIVNMEHSVSKLTALYETEETSHPYQVAKGIDVTTEEATTTSVTINDETTLYLHYESPWTNGAENCNRFIAVKFKKNTPEPPLATYKGVEIPENGVIYTCLGRNIAPIIITKAHNNYDVFGTVENIINEERLNTGDKIISNPLELELNNLTIDGKDLKENPGIYNISLEQSDIYRTCVSQRLNFMLNIIDVTIDETPIIETDANPVCQSLAKEEVELRVIKSENQKKFDVRWYRSIRTTVEGRDTVLQDAIGDGDNILVPIDTDGTFWYNAEFFLEQCPSDQSEIFLTVAPKADTIKTDTITVCQSYTLTSNDIIGKINAWNGNTGTWSAGNLMFYEYLETTSDTALNISNSIKGDSLSLDKLTKRLNTDDATACGTDGFYHLNFVVRGVSPSPNSCPGAGSLVTVKVNCYDNTAPAIMDSILYCTGDEDPSKDLHEFLTKEERTDRPSSNYRWFWQETTVTTPLPHNRLDGRQFSDTPETFDPTISTATANTRAFDVVRIDSNNCVSEKNEFKIVVADAINTFPRVDTVYNPTVVNGNLALNYCKGASPYSSNVVPTVGFPSRSNIIEWYWHEGREANCDTLAEKHYDRMNHELRERFDDTGQRDYCVRQTTPMGCHGPWLHVRVTVHENIEELPIADTTSICAGESTTIKVKNPNPQKYVLDLFDSEKNEINANGMILDTTEGKYFTSSGKNLYFARLKDPTTGCTSPLTGINAIVHPKPNLPSVIGDTTVYLCAGGEPFGLADRVRPAIHKDDQHTSVVWTAPNGSHTDTISTAKNTLAKYTIHQVDTLTQCAGDEIEITVKVEQTFRYTNFGERTLCHGESLLMRDAVGQLIHIDNNIIDSTSVGFKIFRLMDNARSTTEVGNDPVSSGKEEHLSDTTRYLIEVMDSVSGCFRQDTATLIFHELPHAKVVERLSQCQSVSLELPTPTDERYSYTWRDGNGNTINGIPAKLALESDERISLTETDKVFGCEKTFFVDVTVFPTPKSAKTADTSFCQNGTELRLKGETNGADDGFNTPGNLALQWFNERMDSIANTVKTDTIPVNGLIEEYRYTLRQTNTVTRCFKDTSITLSLRRNIRLAMADLKAVCEPETIDFAKEVNNYIHDNTEKINLVNAEGIRPTFAKTENGKTTVVSAEEATALAYADGKDKVDYLYAISDRDNVCTASDTVTVTIHRKPLSPVIENGLDSIFFCGNLEVVKIGAKDINPDTDETNIFWGEASSTIEGDSLNITSKEKRYTAFAKNILTGCVSEPDTIAAVISDPIKVSPIGENGKIELCAGERLDVANSAKSSFSIAQRWNSDITYTATLNGNTTNINALTDVSSMSQDTFVYEFTATDKLTGCEARNTLTLIFHDKPTFGIAGDTLLCQGEDLVLNTLGEERSTSYTWLFDGSDITESSSDKLVKKGLWQDTTVLVIAQLNGTSCTESQKQRILINETPAKLTDQSFVFCQTETNPSRSILLARTEEEKGRFDLQWHDSETNVVDNDDVLNISIAKDTAYTLSVRQVNNDRDANCQGELSTVSIRINKHIEVALRDTNICMPERFNLGKYAQEGKSESADGFNLKTDRILKGEGNTMTPVADSSQIEETGSYHIFYSDKNGCETTTKVKVEFISQPAAPTFDETMPIHLCQGIDTTVTPRFTAGNFEYIWEKTGAGETSVTDTLKIQASRSTEETVSYKVWRRDTLHGCESDKTDLSYQILDSIKTIHMEPIHLCESESVDLDSVAGQLFASANILEHKIYFSDPMQNKGGQLLYSNAVAEKGFYLVEAKDPVSGCNAKNLVEVQTHTNPTLLYKGDTSLCDRSDVNLTAYPKEGETTPAYQWTDAKGKSIQGNALSFTTKLEEGRTEARRDTLVLTGAYNITNQKSCVSRQTVEIITHPIPPTLENDTIDICQNPGSVKIKVDYQDNVFDLKRYDSDNNEITEISVGTENVTNERFSVAQEDRITKCRGKSADIFVNVRQGISLHIDEQEAICAPATVNLTDIVGKATRESNEEVAERKVFTTKSITLNGAEVNDPTAVGQSGLYRIVIEDQYGCQAGASIQLTVHQRPAPISGDTAFCQGTGMQKLAGAGTADGLTIEWLDLATAYPDSVYTDTLKVSTEREGEMFYLVRQTNAESQCSSESSPMSITIHPAIKATLMDTTICFGSSFDFMEYAQRHVEGGLNPYLKNARCADPVLPIDYNAIKQEGTFIALYTDAHQCEASDTMTLSRAPKIDLALEYTKEVCAGDTITVKAKGAQHYVWNGDSNDTDTFSAATSTEGTQEISLTASIVVNSDKGTSCSADTTIQVKVNKVPGLISGYGETAYCQNYPTEPLSLTPTDKEASVLWYDPNDGYSTVSKNGTLKPASLYAGDFVYKFRQQLGECQTTLQDYMVSIQSGIEETAVVNDTAYCKDETTAPLLAKWENPLYEVIWSNEEGEELTPGFRPSSSAAGQQLYSARLAYKACQGDASTLRISIQEKYDRKPDINDNFIFCEKTGKHTIKANGNDIGTRLNWYEENGNERLDSIVIDTDNPSWRNAKFFATQSVINGCESPSAPFEVSIKEAVQPQTILLDTCAGVTVTLGELMKMHDITDRADTLWMGADKSQRLDLNSKIDRSGEYLFSVVNPFGCKATHTARINMLKVEDLEYTTPKSIYCYDETVSLHASASNADIEWENITEGTTHYGTSYEFALNGSANVAMTATISSKPACKDTVDFQFETYDMTVAVINGDTNACIGNTILLSTGNLYQTRWSVGDTTATSDDFSYTPSKSDFLTVEGFDKNQCPVKKTLTIKTAKQPDPTILVTPAIHSATYHLNRDTFEVHLEASLSSVLDENYSYKWDFGDGNTFYGGNTENHEYDASLVRLTKPIDVSLTVEHAYGCAGSATTRLLIDPDFDVPNTMTPEDVFMEDYELQIFDRIGNLVFEGRGWHGQTNNSEDAFGDTYFYAISYFVSGEKKIKTGYITLVR